MMDGTESSSPSEWTSADEADTAQSELFRIIRKDNEDLSKENNPLSVGR